MYPFRLLTLANKLQTFTSKQLEPSKYMLFSVSREKTILRLIWTERKRERLLLLCVPLAKCDIATDSYEYMTGIVESRVTIVSGWKTVERRIHLRSSASGSVESDAIGPNNYEMIGWDWDEKQWLDGMIIRSVVYEMFIEVTVQCTCKNASIVSRPIDAYTCVYTYEVILFFLVFSLVGL